jgi:hypothetical protein
MSEYIQKDPASGITSARWRPSLQALPESLRLVPYFIVPKRGKCHISCQNVHYEPYESPLQAFGTAVDCAQGNGQEEIRRFAPQFGQLVSFRVVS